MREREEEREREKERKKRERNMKFKQISLITICPPTTSDATEGYYITSNKDRRTPMSRREVVHLCTGLYRCIQLPDSQSAPRVTRRQQFTLFHIFCGWSTELFLNEKPKQCLLHFYQM